MRHINATDRIRSLLAFLKAKNVESVLQIGCLDAGATIVLVESGFSATVMCTDSKQLLQLRNELVSNSRDAKLLELSPDEIDKTEQSYDFILAYNSLYSTDYQGLKTRLDKLFQVLKPDGFFYMTLISTKHSYCGKGDEIESNTFSYMDQIRHFSDPAEIVPMMKHVEIVDMRHQEQDETGSFFWHILGRNRDLFPDEDEENTNCSEDNHIT